MKKLLFLAALLGCTTFLPAQSLKDEVDMYTLTRNYMAAYNRSDHGALQEMYTDDAVRIDPKGNRTEGAKNIATALAEQFRFANATLLLRHHGLSWSDTEHAFVAKGFYEIYGITNVYDIEIDVTGQYANTVLQKDGEWKIAKSVLSPLGHKDLKVAANIELYTETWDRIINGGEMELFNEERFVPGVVMHTEPEVTVGIDEMAAYYELLLSAFSDYEFTIENIFGEGDQLTKHWSFRGKHTGNYFSVPATGNEISFSGSTIVRMSPDGRIAEEQDFMDNMVVLAQMGAVWNPVNRNVVKELYDAFAKGDIPAALEPMAPDIVWNEAEGFPYADNNPYIGPDAVLNGVFARIGAEWEYWNLTDIQLHEMNGNKILATLRYQAKHKATGKVIDSQTAHLWTLRDGKIIAFQQFTDTKQAMEATQ